MYSMQSLKSTTFKNRECQQRLFKTVWKKSFWTHTLWAARPCRGLSIAQPIGATWVDSEQSEIRWWEAAVLQPISVKEVANNKQHIIIKNVKFHTTTVQIRTSQKLNKLGPQDLWHSVRKFQKIFYYNISETFKWETFANIRKFLI